MAPKTHRLKPEADIASRAEFDQCLDNIANGQIERDALVLERDNELLQIREEFDPKINALNERMNALLLRAERYALANRESLFGKLKSAASALTTYGFRLGNPTLKLLNRKWNWDRVIEALRNCGDVQYIVHKVTVDKEKIKTELDEAMLAQRGLWVDQTEAFFVEPKRDAAADQRLLTSGKAVA